MGHLEPSPPEATLHIETLIRLRTIQNALVAADLLSDVVQSLYYAQAELLALLVFGHSNVLNMADEPEVVDELALDDQGTCADNARGGVEDGEEEVLIVVPGEPLVALVPLLDGGGEPWFWEEVSVYTHLLCHVADGREHA